MAALSFFDTTLDEILLLDTNGAIIGKREHISLIDLANTRDFEAEWEGSLLTPPEVCSKLVTTTVIFIDLDFFDTLDVVRRACPQTITFSGNPQGSHIDLAITEPYIEALPDLERIVKEHGESVYFYTKHTKALRNFLEYNSLICGNILETSLS